MKYECGNAWQISTHHKNAVLLASKRHSGAQSKFRFKILAKLQCAVTVNKGVPPEREELQPELPQCRLLATNIWALTVLVDPILVDPSGNQPI